MNTSDTMGRIVCQCPCGRTLSIQNVDGNVPSEAALGILCANTCDYPWRIGSPASAALDLAKAIEVLTP